MKSLDNFFFFGCILHWVLWKLFWFLFCNKNQGKWLDVKNERWIFLELKRSLVWKGKYFKIFWKTSQTKHTLLFILSFSSSCTFLPQKCLTFMTTFFMLSVSELVEIFALGKASCECCYACRCWSMSLWWMVL